MFNLFVNYTLAFSIFLFISFQNLYSNDFEDWKSFIISEAIKAGISEKTINQNLQPIVSVNNKVLKLYNNQPEFKISFNSYINRNINEKRIKKGKKLYKKNSELLDIIFKKYNIPPQIIISIWALESNFGYYTGNFKIVDALATLSFKSRRKSFFKKELFSALRIIDQSLIEANELKGSWAGAMGQSQFMPSSYLSYAIDFNKDGNTDSVGVAKDVVCKRKDNSKPFDRGKDCKTEEFLYVFKNNNDKSFEKYQVMPVSLNGSFRIEAADINKDGTDDIYGFKEDWFNPWIDCKKQVSAMYFNQDNKSFEQASKSFNKENFGLYGCERASSFFKKNNNFYRLFITIPSTDSKFAYLGIEKY